MAKKNVFFFCFLLTYWYLCSSIIQHSFLDMAQSESTPSSFSPRLTLRLSRDMLAFAQVDPSVPNGIRYESYPAGGGVSTAAHLRDAFGKSDLLTAVTTETRAHVLVDAPVMVVPVEEFRQRQAELLFQHTFSGHEAEHVMWTGIPSLNAVALFSVNKDLRLVLEDHFQDIRWNHVCIPVWTHLHRRSFTGVRRKLYAWFHDRSMELFAFQQNRFRYVNTFEMGHVADVVYFVLNVWKHLALDQKHDELHLLGDVPQRDALQEELHQYVQNVYVLNPAADFNRDAVTKIEGLPYDLMAVFARRFANG